MPRYFLDACYPVGFQPNYDGYLSYCDAGCAFQPNLSNFPVRYVISSAARCGIIGDVEPGNPGWNQWTVWVEETRAMNLDPTLYCCADGYGSNYFDGWRHADGVAAFAAAGIPEPHWWVFDLTGGGVIPPYAVAVQFATGVRLDGINEVDISAVGPYWPGIDTAVPPLVGSKEDMFIFNGPDGVGYLVCQLGLVPLPNIDFANMLTADGVKWYHVDQSNHDALLAAAAAHTISGTLPLTLGGTGSVKIG